MNRTMFLQLPQFGLLLLGAWTLPLVSFAAEEAEPAPKKSEKSIADHMNSISAERNEIIRKTIDDYINSGEDLNDKDVRAAIHDALSKKVEFQPKTPADQRTFSQLTKDTRKHVDEKFKMSTASIRAEALKDAEEKFQMHKQFDLVTVQYQRGSNSFTIKGKYNGRSGNSIKIDHRYIAMFDLLPEYRVMFDEDANKVARQEYVNLKISAYKKRKSEYSQKLYQEALEKQRRDNENAGYIYMPKLKHWFSAKELAELYINTELANLDDGSGKPDRTEKTAGKKEPAAVAVAVPDTSAPQNPPAAEPVKPSVKVVPPTAAAAQSGSETVPAESANDDDEKKESVVAKKVPSREDVEYEEIVKQVKKRLMEIATNFSGIDSDQGYNKALWGMTRDDIYIIMRKDEANSERTEARLLDVIQKKNSVDERVELHYINKILYKVVIVYAKMKPSEFQKFINSLHEKYGRSDEEKLADEGKTVEPVMEDGYQLCHWTGKNTVGTLMIKYNADQSALEDMRFVKECPSLRDSLQKK